MSSGGDKDIPLCTPIELERLLQDDDGMLRWPSHDYNEIVPGIIIGSRIPALRKALLKKLEVTHVLNMAQGNQFAHVDTDEKYYEDAGIKFLGFRCSDLVSTNLSQHFDETSNYIESVLSENGKVLVHCYEGYSRASTTVIAFLMIKKGMTVQNAAALVRAKREIGPNDAFLKQLCQLNETLYKERKKLKETEKA